MRRLTALDIWIGNQIGKLFTIASEMLDDGARNLIRCENCGENVFYGKPCPERR